MEEPEFWDRIAVARRTNARRDRLDRDNGFAAPMDTPISVQVGTVMAALECAIRMQDWTVACEAFALAADLRAQLVVGSN